MTNFWEVICECNNIKITLLAVMTLQLGQTNYLQTVLDLLNFNFLILVAHRDQQNMP